MRRVREFIYFYFVPRFLFCCLCRRSKKDVSWISWWEWTNDNTVLCLIRVSRIYFSTAFYLSAFTQILPYFTFLLSNYADRWIILLVVFWLSQTIHPIQCSSLCESAHHLFLTERLPTCPPMTSTQQSTRPTINNQRPQPPTKHLGVLEQSNAVTFVTSK